MKVRKQRLARGVPATCALKCLGLLNCGAWNHAARSESLQCLPCKRQIEISTLQHAHNMYRRPLAAACCWDALLVETSSDGAQACSAVGLQCADDWQDVCGTGIGQSFNGTSTRASAPR